MRLTLSVENPNPAQQIAEMIHEFTGGSAEQIIGHGYERFQAFVTCIFLFVLINNLLGLIPGDRDPDQPRRWFRWASRCATFLYYNFYGFKEQGFVGYLKHFAGPIWWMAWLLFPIEIISHLRAHHVAHHPSLRQHVCQRPGDAGLLLADSDRHSGHLSRTARRRFAHSGFVFMLLTMIYLSLAVAHEH